MTTIPKIESFASDLTAIRQDFHAHPELGFEEVRTSGIVAAQLRAYGAGGWQPPCGSARRYGRAADR